MYDPLAPALELDAMDAPSDGSGTGSGRAGLRGLYAPRVPVLGGPPGFSRGLPGPLRTVGLADKLDAPEELDATEVSRKLPQAVAWLVEGTPSSIPEKDKQITNVYGSTAKQFSK